VPVAHLPSLNKTLLSRKTTGHRSRIRTYFAIQNPIEMPTAAKITIAMPAHPAVIAHRKVTAC
jgi:hypothetical protein